MKRLFRKGQRVRSKKSGRVMEALQYIRDKNRYLVECSWFDLEKKEVRISKHEEANLMKVF